MSNRNKILLSEKQLQKKKKMLLEMQEEIRKIETEISLSGVKNLQANLFRWSKISLRTGQLILPYAVTIGITLGAFSSLGRMPFIRDDVKRNLEIKKELDSNGKIRYEEQYNKFDDAISTVSYFEKWQRETNGLYSRNVKTYIVDRIPEDILNKVLNEKFISLDEVLGEPMSSKVEKKNNLTHEEINADSYIQAIIYKTINDDYIIVKEPVVDNIGITAIWIILTVLLESIPYQWRKTESSFYYLDYISEIKAKHPTIDVKVLKRKLEIKKENYNRLMR